MTKVTTKSIIILSGPVGAGKSTVAQEIVKSSPGPVVYIEGDKFWFFIVKGFSHGKSFKTVMTAMTAAAVSYALFGYEVILDFSMPPWFLETALRIAGARNVPIEYIVLRPAENVCAARAAARLEGTIADYSSYHELYLSFDVAQQYIINNDLSDAKTIAGQIREGLMDGIFSITSINDL